MPTYGRRTHGSTGIPLMVSADGAPEWKAGGVTLDWSKVTAEASDRTLSDGTVIKAGFKGLELGTVLCEIALGEVQTVTVSGSPTGGTYTLKATGGTVETATIAYNAAAAAVQTAIRGLGGAYAGVVVTGSAGGPYTVTFPVGGGDVVALTLGTNSLTGGSSPSAAVTTGTAGTAPGTYGPYRSDATDGRQNLTRGRCFILNETITELGPLGMGTAPTDHPGVFEGGRVWRARLRVGQVNPTSIGGDAPTVAAFEAAFPRISYVDA